MRALLLTVVLALAPSALAQGPAASSADAQASSIAFSLQVTVPTSDAPVPEVVVALSNDPHLARLDLSRTESPREKVRAEFAFHDMADYVAWRESARVVALLAELDAAAQGRGMATAFQLVRPPSADRLQDEG